MPGASRKTTRTYEVLVSFDGLDKGDRFTEDSDHGWAEKHVETGYLQDVTEGVADVRGDEGKG